MSKWIIKSESGSILTHPNGAYRVFKSPNEALDYIEKECGNSPYLKPERLFI